MCLHSPDPREILRRTSNYQVMSAEPLEPEQGQTAGLGLHGNQEISGNTAGVPHLLRAKLYMSHSPCWPKDRERQEDKDQYSTQDQKAQARQAFSHRTRGSCRESKASSLRRRCQREAELLWLTAQRSDSDVSESTHASESAEPKDK